MTGNVSALHANMCKVHVHRSMRRRAGLGLDHCAGTLAVLVDFGAVSCRRLVVGQPWIWQPIKRGSELRLLALDALVTASAIWWDDRERVSADVVALSLSVWLLIMT